MSEEHREETPTQGDLGQASESAQASEDQERPQGPPPTPFDHPLFLPALLIAGMLWFGYDGWINQDPEMLEHQTFNRYGFGVLTVAAAWFGYKGWNEWQEERAARDSSDSSGPPPIT